MFNKALVLDANILVRAVLGVKALSLINNHYQMTRFCTPAVCLNDASKYLPVLLKKRGASVESGLKILKRLEDVVEVVDISIYELFEENAKTRIFSRDLDDWPIVATALALNCPIWTEDKDFFGVGIPTWTTDRVHIYLGT